MAELAAAGLSAALRTKKAPRPSWCGAEKGSEGIQPREVLNQLLLASVCGS